jgi:hypothetical protein
MILKHAISMTALTLLLAGPLAAQEATAPQMTPEMKAMMEAMQKAGTPGAEHQKLTSLAGTYDLTIKSWHGPGSEPTTDTGTATRKMILGNRVVVEEVNSQMMGQPFTGQGLHGYDNVTGKHWSTWNDSMSTGLMVSEGTCDAKLACSFTGTYHDPVQETSDHPLDRRHHRSLRDVRARPRWQGSQDDGDHLQEARAVIRHQRRRAGLDPPLPS